VVVRVQEGRPEGQMGQMGQKSLLLPPVVAMGLALYSA